MHHKDKKILSESKTLKDIKAKKKKLARIIFLKLLTKEIILQTIERKRTGQAIETEKLKQSIFEEDLSERSNEAFKELLESQQPGHERKKAIHRELLPNKNLTNYPLISANKRPLPIKKEVSSPTGMQKSSFSNGTKAERPVIVPRQPIKPPTQIVQVSNVPPMERIAPMLRDNTVLTIECPGPGKNILVRRYNQINVTHVILSEADIKFIIDYYSKEAKIPLAGGILKAAVGNSIISAVVSEFVGSRFVINKMTPYSLLSQ